MPKPPNPQPESHVTAQTARPVFRVLDADVGHSASGDVRLTLRVDPHHSFVLQVRRALAMMLADAIGRGPPPAPRDRRAS